MYGWSDSVQSYMNNGLLNALQNVLTYVFFYLQLKGCIGVQECHNKFTMTIPREFELVLQVEGKQDTFNSNK